MEKKCNGCKKTLNINRFTQDEKVYSKCHTCRVKLVKRKNSCEKCGIQAIYNYEGMIGGIRCSKHKEPDMVDVKNKKCVVCKKKRPCFNVEGSSIATHCGDCKGPDMVDIKNKKCVVCKKKQPYFNVEGSSIATHCGDCKGPNMVDIKSKKCVVCKKKIPHFNVEGSSIATHCGDCKGPEMVNVKDKKCVVCKKKIPVFNAEGSSIATHCGDCKGPDMVDIKHKKCLENGCRKRAIFAQPGVLPEYCTVHKKVGMTSKPRKRCEEQECKEIAIYGVDGPVHCEEHKKEDEYHLCERECKKCKRIDVLNREGICVNFCSLEEKDRVVKKLVKKHEEFIGNLLKAEIDIPWMYQNEVVDRKCSNKRPDFVYHCGDHIVMIEVDEDQHKSYKCSAYGDTKEGKMKAERVRMYEICQSFDGLPCVFLRYNPDNYRVNGKLVKFSASKRHDILVKWVRKCIREKMDGFGVKYLFYDDFIESDGNFEKIDENEVVCI